VTLPAVTAAQTAQRNLNFGSRPVLALPGTAVSNGVPWISPLAVMPQSAWAGELYFQASVAGSLDVFYLPPNAPSAGAADPFFTTATRQSLLAAPIAITANTLSVNRWQINLPPRFFIVFTPSGNGTITVAEVNAPAMGR